MVSAWRFDGGTWVVACDCGAVYRWRGLFLIRWWRGEGGDGWCWWCSYWLFDGLCDLVGDSGRGFGGFWRGALLLGGFWRPALVVLYLVCDDFLELVVAWRCGGVLTGLSRLWWFGSGGGGGDTDWWLVGRSILAVVVATMEAAAVVWWWWRWLWAASWFLVVEWSLVMIEGGFGLVEIAVGDCGVWKRSWDCGGEAVRELWERVNCVWESAYCSSCVKVHVLCVTVCSVCSVCRKLSAVCVVREALCVVYKSKWTPRSC